MKTCSFIRYNNANKIIEMNNEFNTKQFYNRKDTNESGFIFNSNYYKLQYHIWIFIKALILILKTTNSKTSNNQNTYALHFDYWMFLSSFTKTQ